MKKKIILDYPRLFLMIITAVAIWLIIYFAREGMYNYKLLAAAGLVASAWLPNLIAALLKVRIPNVVVIVYYYFLVLTILLGIILGFYRIISWYDDFTHFLAGALLVLLGIFIATRLDNVGFLKFSLLLTYGLFFAGFCVGIWEIVEYVLVRTVMPAGSYSPARSEVVIDLIMNALGAFMVVILLTLDARAYGHKYLERLLRKFTHEGPPDRTNEKSF
ncbi:MAG TPA: hypothetical protein PKO39_07915 [Bacilli bacterium]|jgi:hypothetical protein|nr:hypothetical protein [Acholeplasmataceae bacterium]HOA79353.1 hypothetical protein [Bacilli bacterium]HPZ28024.1 hypothetical protein [Bacilli bacterium]HQC90160.1 hypothetical protein [Bacilli bacterium]